MWADRRHPERSNPSSPAPSFPSCSRMALQASGSALRTTTEEPFLSRLRAQVCLLDVLVCGQRRRGVGQDDLAGWKDVAAARTGEGHERSEEAKSGSQSP